MMTSVVQRFKLWLVFAPFDCTRFLLPKHIINHLSIVNTSTDPLLISTEATVAVPFSYAAKFYQAIGQRPPQHRNNVVEMNLVSLLQSLYEQYHCAAIRTLLLRLLEVCYCFSRFVYVNFVGDIETPSESVFCVNALMSSLVTSGVRRTIPTLSPPSDRLLAPLHATRTFAFGSHALHLDQLLNVHQCHLNPLS